MCIIRRRKAKRAEGFKKWSKLPNLGRETDIQILKPKEELNNSINQLD
jgi:hypothetical protein